MIAAGPGVGSALRVTGLAKDGATIEGLTVSGGEHGIRLDSAARVRDVRVVGADTGVLVGPGDDVAVLLERLDIAGGRVGIDVMSGNVELHRSRVHDSSERGSHVRGAEFLAMNTLVTGHAVEGVVAAARDVTIPGPVLLTAGSDPDQQSGRPGSSVEPPK